MKQTSIYKAAALGVAAYALAVLSGDGMLLVMALVAIVSWAFDKNLPTIYRKIKNHSVRRAIYDALKEED